jgi:SAM-dependent methyltransferase
MTAEFDKFANDYDKLVSNNIKASGYDPTYFDEHKIREVHRRCGEEYKGTFSFLNFGCGIGKSEKFIRKYFPLCSIHSVDVSPESLKVAKEKNKNIRDITFYHFEDVTEFNPGMKFEIIFVANVFHHIPETLHEITLIRLNSLLSPNGKLFIFEHNPLNPLTRRAFNTCEFDHGCKMISSGRLRCLIGKAGFNKVEINYTLFFPKILQRLTFLEKYMTSLPIGAQYYAVCRNV